MLKKHQRESFQYCDPWEIEQRQKASKSVQKPDVAKPILFVAVIALSLSVITLSLFLFGSNFFSASKNADEVLKEKADEEDSSFGMLVDGSQFSVNACKRTRTYHRYGCKAINDCCVGLSLKDARDQGFNACTSCLASTIVYITNTGYKYHNAWCRHLAMSNKPVELLDVFISGYTACSECSPPVMETKSDYTFADALKELREKRAGNGK